MKEFIAFVLQYGTLNQYQLELISKKGDLVSLCKDEHFSEAGKISKQFGFILNGVIRVYYYNNKGEEVTIHFIEENNIVVDLNSFATEIPSSYYVQAITDCKLIVFSIANWQELLNRIIGWDIISSKITSKALLEKVEKRSLLVSEDATTRYERFLEVYPNLVNRIPLSYIASYLGITQQSFSRIRKNIR
tara:strand:+ start:31356 stop:31925 length:570 start_codon:yes stop_codon:yes gene_type:complete